MKVFKNLMGNNDKIHADEIAVKPDILLGKTVIVETGNNSNGYWIKWGNGFAICWREITFNRDMSVGEKGIPKPIIFNENYPLFGGTVSTSMDSYKDRNDLHAISTNDYFDLWSWARVSQHEEWSGTGVFSFQVWSAGFVD